MSDQDVRSGPSVVSPAQSLVNNLYEEPVEYYKEAARFIERVDAAYAASRTGDPNDKDTQYRNLLKLAADVREALDGVYR